MFEINLNKDEIAFLIHAAKSIDRGELDRSDSTPYEKAITTSIEKLEEISPEECKSICYFL
ncbi:hypothetical protein HCA78_11495 [Listeria booriae]|uniref:Uncharacterized protein n=1 Tax=Listeria booriae TaxID=1552123 RepID=A0A842CRE1_9LIST|nr:hypothetical protein [Listeria booriae]MBC2004395.1 hypothetical protein [Listeria booriae]MBC2158691.1 hypothetical protein [Listeria booriae]